jgi:hypothetical protein
MALSVRERTRRTVILCGHCLRNIAFYRAGWRNYKPRITRQFWISANGSAMDLALLEWCKLFADWKGKHHWSKTVTDKNGFTSGLYSRLRMTEAQFADYVETMKRPRDKFIAHLDEDAMMKLPRLRPARASAAYLHDALLTGKDTQQWFLNEEQSLAREIYAMLYKHAVTEYRAAQDSVTFNPGIHRRKAKHNLGG